MSEWRRGARKTPRLIVAGPLAARRGRRPVASLRLLRFVIVLLTPRSAKLGRSRASRDLAISDRRSRGTRQTRLGLRTHRTVQAKDAGSRADRSYGSVRERVRRPRTLGWAALCGALATIGIATFASSAEAAPPQVGATWVTSVTATSVNLHAEVDPGGLASTYRFEYLGEAAYRADLEAGGEGFDAAAHVPAGSEAPFGSEEEFVPVVQHLEGLAPETSYRFRVLARNGSGATPGPVRSFATEGNAVPGGAACPNAQLRIEDASTGLPDCRGWELVSPADKNGGQVGGAGAYFGGGVLQAAAGGGEVTYSSSASFGPEAAGAPPASQYLSRRGAGGWQTQNITAPTLSGAYGTSPEGVPYQLFSPDLARGLMLDGSRCPGGAECARSYSLRDEAGALEPTLEAPGLRFAGSDPALVHLVFSTCAALSADATEVPAAGGGGCDPADPNLYEWSGGAPQLINLLPGQTTGTPGALLGAQSGAVSANGARVYWSAADGDLYLYEAGVGKLVDGSGQAVFQSASEDGAVAYFLKAGHLYRYLASDEGVTDLTPAGGVLGVLGASPDGSHVYYATAGAIFLWDEGALGQVAAAAEAADPTDYPPATGTARVSAAGEELAFLSRAPLAADNTDPATGQPDTEVYLYEAASGDLICASCNPTGERPLGPSSIPGAIADGSGPAATDSYKPRVLVAGGARLFFDSSDRLLPRDTSAAEDVYEWEAGGEGSCIRPGGCLALISSGRSATPSEFVDASEDGADAYFLTSDPLAAGDPGSVDLYDAREDGGYPVPTPPIPCEGDACQPLPTPPEDPSPGTLVASTPNPKPTFPKTACSKGKSARKGRPHGCGRKTHHRKPHHKKAHRRKGRRHPQQKGAPGNHDKGRPTGGHK
jgi:hypothetical protein